METAAVTDLQLDASSPRTVAPEMPKQPARGKSRRLVDKHTQSEVPPPAEKNELDRERAELIRRNQEMLAKFGVQQALQDVRRAKAVPAFPRPERPRAGAADTDNAGAGPSRPAAARGKRARGEVEPMRRSGRLAGAAAAAAIADVVEAERDGASGRGVGVMTQEEYLKSKGESLPEGWFRSDGRFRGWVKPEVAERLGIASSAAEAWEQGGGGKFVRKISKSDVPASLKAKGWSDARAFSASQLRKNPNAYFYRHTAPGEPQAQGEWTKEEHELFLQTARQHGVGDKWGLFASYIPNRVGYQCSAYYAQVIIPLGLILDDRYRMDAWGDAVFMGARGGRDD